MRNFKFRAWSKQNKGMFFQNFTFSDFTQMEFSKTDWNDLCVMQYTGLKDKNGVEIYEGDIIRIIKDEQRITARISYTLTYMGYTIGNPKNLMEVAKYDDGSYVEESALHEYVKYMYENSPYIEVIGNIYQNPELTN